MKATDYFLAAIDGAGDVQLSREHAGFQWLPLEAAQVAPRLAGARGVPPPPPDAAAGIVRRTWRSTRRCATCSPPRRARSDALAGARPGGRRGRADALGPLDARGR